MNAQAVVIMGVSGSGKTTIGEMLSQELGWPFYDGDSFHPEANVKKMASGTPLNDEDRKPWLERLQQLIQSHISKNESVIVGCSALKEGYRSILRGDLERLSFVYLEGSFDLILARMKARKGHFMKENMLKSQFATLEPPVDAITVSIAEPPEEITARIISRLKASPGSS